jgi:transposase
MVTGGNKVPEAARALGLVEQTLRNWVKAAAQGRLHEGAKEVTPEQMELSRLRAENVRLKLEVELQKNPRRAALFLAGKKLGGCAIHCWHEGSGRLRIPVKMTGDSGRT